MARMKNAKRKHEIAPFDPRNPLTEPGSDDWKRLAKYIETIDDETDEDTDDTGYYDGDGTPEETVLSVVGGYSFEGIFDPEDEAQAMIAAMKYKTGDARRVWHRVTTADGKKTYTQVANVSEIKAGAGDATAYEEFGCTIKWIKEPIEKGIGG
ncbi:MULTISPECIES: phage tail tube protein [Streptococcus]|uniref:Phage tail tube protein n=1 Tax=Streptococcus caledonicus TaxID=2614158 RepID=A0ABW0U9G5_9STRE|nr:phage tail protein [Streptococcus sp. S784/96/1]